MSQVIITRTKDSDLKIKQKILIPSKCISLKSSLILLSSAYSRVLPFLSLMCSSLFLRMILLVSMVICPTTFPSASSAERDKFFRDLICTGCPWKGNENQFPIKNSYFRRLIIVSSLTFSRGSLWVCSMVLDVGCKFRDWHILSTSHLFCFLFFITWNCIPLQSFIALPQSGL